VAAVVCRDIDNRNPPAGVEVELEDAWAWATEEAARYGNPQSHPRIRPWRERFRAIGISGSTFPSSIEALLRRARRTREPLRINPVVDFYHAVSLRHLVPAGGFDLAKLTGNLHLRLTQEGEEFLALDADGPEPVPAGEVAYTDDTTILTRHFVWRQAKAGLIDRRSQDLVLLAEVLGELERSLIETVCGDLSAGLERYFDVAAQAFILDKDRSVTIL
jgi:DNA/RNA-binding domain of Phe-tRNA-synthetase-like protein